MRAALLRALRAEQAAASAATALKVVTDVHGQLVKIAERGSSPYRSGKGITRADLVRYFREKDGVTFKSPGVVARSVNLLADALGFQRREEALHRRIVPDVARAAHRADDAIVGH